MGSFSESERASGGGYGSSLQCSCLENPMDREAWWATVCGVKRESDMIETAPETLFRKQRAGKIPQLCNQCVTSSFILNTISRKEVNVIKVLLFNYSRSASPYWANATTQNYTSFVGFACLLNP